MAGPSRSTTATAAPTFTGADLDRATELRQDPERVARLLAEPGTSVLAASADGVLLAGGALARRRLDGDAGRYLDPSQLILLGVEPEGALFATDLETIGSAR